jgi:protein-S-isoprenylcysteine O-methyltransferase Ste14
MNARASRKSRMSGFRLNPFGIFSSLNRRRLANLFAPRRPRAPLLRVAFALVGLGLLAVLLIFSVLIGGAMLAIGLLWRQWRRRGRPKIDATAGTEAAIEGEYRVVRKPALPSRFASVR